MPWDMDVGDEDSRTEIHRRHRGSHSRGISAPARDSGLDNILLWWSPARGETFGYADGWNERGDAFHFSGTGVEGDQRFGFPHQENVRVRDHAANGDQIRLLRYVGKNTVRYVGELRLDPVHPWSWRDGHDRFGELRRMIQFRLLPVGDVLRLQDDPVRMEPNEAPHAEPLPSELPESSKTDVERLGSPQFQRLVRAQTLISERRELRLVHEFREWLADVHRLEATGLRIPYRVEARELRADLFLSNPRVLIEAKSTTAREKIRLALGQLLDYRRWLDPPPRLCVLLPAEPPLDMLELLRSVDIACAWQEQEGGFSVVPTSLLK